MPTGTVKWYIDSKGRYIESDDGGAEIYFKRLGIRNYDYVTVNPGMHVEYEVVESRPGPEAIRIRPVATDT